MKNVNVRLDDNLHARLVAAAERDRRSLQQQIIWLLEASVDGDPATMQLQQRARTILRDQR